MVADAKPCHNGHVAPRTGKRKRCTECKRAARRRWLLTCPDYASRRRQQYAADPEPLRKAAREWKRKNPRIGGLGDDAEGLRRALAYVERNT